MIAQLHFPVSVMEDLGIGDYPNCPMNKEEYDTFVDEPLPPNVLLVTIWLNPFVPGMSLLRK